MTMLLVMLYMYNKGILKLLMMFYSLFVKVLYTKNKYWHLNERFLQYSVYVLFGKMVLKLLDSALQCRS